MKRSTTRSSSASTSATLCGLTITLSSPHSGLSCGQRLLGEDVERGAREGAVLQALGQRGLVDHRAAADVDEHGAGLDRGERVGVEQAARGVGQRQRDDDGVGLRHERGQLARGVELVDVRASPRGVALDRQHAHPERLREPRRLGPDLAEADDQQRAVAQLADGCCSAGQWRSRWSASRVGRSLANASRPKIANSASGPPWTPEEVVTVTRRASLGRELAAPGRAARRRRRCGPGPIRAAARAAARSTRPSPVPLGDAPDDLGALERLRPARVVEARRRPRRCRRCSSARSAAARGGR